MSSHGGAPRIVKKYGNRRLYDTTESRYVTLEELAVSIKGGAEVRVVDAQTGQDLTQTTLAQIILEGRGAAQFLSVPILTQLVRMNDDALADFFGRWLSAALELYQGARQGVQALTPYNPLAAVPFAASRAAAQPGFVRLLPYLPAGRPRLLDVGCGDGRFGRFLAPPPPPRRRAAAAPAVRPLRPPARPARTPAEDPAAPARRRPRGPRRPAPRARRAQVRLRRPQPPRRVRRPAR